jgi:hypothetical protein
MIKTIVFLLLVILIFISCIKDSTNQTTNSGSIQYKVNGNDVSFDIFGYSTDQYAIIWKQFPPTTISTRYTLTAKTGANGLVFTIPTDSLKQTVYHYDSTALFVGAAQFVRYNGVGSFVSTKNDYFDIIVTAYSNGRVSGTFSGKLTPSDSLGTIGPPSSVTVTEGKFNNVEVIFQ